MERSLRKGALGFLDALAMAIAGSAPAYSITVTTAALVAAAGFAGPAALWIAALPIIGIAIAFAYLNRWRPDAGAAYVWVGRAMHPALGFLAGWALLSTSTIFNVAAALPAGQATLDLFAPGLSRDVVWAAGAGAVWFIGVLALVTFGITVSARAQVVLTSLEVLAVVLLCGLAIYNARAAPAADFSWDWFFPSAFGSFQSFSAAMLVALFYYFGWDVSANLAEETAGANTVSGIACILGVMVTVGMFLLAQVAVQMALTPAEIQANGGNLLPALGAAALPAPWSRNRRACGFDQRRRDDRDTAPPVHTAVVFHGARPGDRRGDGQAPSALSDALACGLRCRRCLTSFVRRLDHPAFRQRIDERPNQRDRRASRLLLYVSWRRLRLALPPQGNEPWLENNRVRCGRPVDLGILRRWGRDLPVAATLLASLVTQHRLHSNWRRAASLLPRAQSPPLLL